ncbi:MAG: peptide chain release factor N(5)-glutamine methyltransferase [Calditrichaeota bacterium]|nr:peptide chain release factor N(5)-glutamine methyltransferase [Calditrichota bacterium]
MQTPWTVLKVLNWTVDYFTAHQVPEPRLSAELLLAHTLQCRRIDLYLQFDRILSLQERSRFREYVQRRVRREPVPYILGETEFYGLPFFVQPGVLIPRPETELLVDSVIEECKRLDFKHPNILDLGTGAGCIAIVLAQQFPGARIQAIDIEKSAVELAKKNARRYRVHVEWQVADAFDFLTQTSQRFQVLVSNPPYVARKDWAQLPPEVREHEPRTALDGGSDGLDFYRKLVPLINRVLTHPGLVALETGYDQARRVAEMLTRAGLKTQIRKDYQQIERVVIGTS